MEGFGNARYSIGTMPKSIKELLSLDDPLCDEAFEVLLNFREEEGYVDYKLTFHKDDERAWLELTKDVMAFANTNGGYLVFGLEDRSFKQVGLDDNAVRTIQDSNALMQKINRHADPEITSVRSKSFTMEGKIFVAILIPPSLGKTHLISKDAAFKFPSGEVKVLLRKGTIYIRRSGTNHLVDARDLDEIVDRRITYYKSSLLDKIARVVEAPQASQIVVVPDARASEGNTKFILTDSPDAIPVKGIGFTVSPTTTEQEIAGWIAMTGREQEALPSSAITWKWYRERHTLQLTAEQRLHIARYCLLSEVPAFYWIKGCKARDIKSMLTESLRRHRTPDIVSNVVSMAAFLGKTFHSSLLRSLGTYVKRLPPRELKFPPLGPRNLFRADRVGTRGLATAIATESQDSLEAELQELAQIAERVERQKPNVMQLVRARTLDCHLYAQDDKYAG